MNALLSGLSVAELEALRDGMAALLKGGESHPLWPVWKRHGLKALLPGWKVLELLDGAEALKVDPVRTVPPHLKSFERMPEGVRRCIRIMGEFEAAMGRPITLGVLEREFGDAIGANRLRFLEDAGWIHSEELPDGRTGYRPSKKFYTAHAPGRADEHEEG